MCQETLHESSLHASAVRTYIALNRCDFTPEQPDMSQETRVVLLACALLLTCVALSAVSGLTPRALPPVARPMSGARVVIVRDEDSGTFRQYELHPGKDHAMLHALDNGRTIKFPICLNVLPS
jgi:hypothetical protein